MRVVGTLGDTPVESLAKPIAQSLILIAPERVEQTRELIAGLTLEYVPDREWVCETPLEEKLIKISAGFLDHLWASSLAIWLLYSRHLSGRLIDQNTILEFADDPVLDSAMKLLHWSVSKDGGIWPKELPSPTFPPKKDSDDHAATEIMLCATAFLFHHELAHLRLAHPPNDPGVESIQNEREADNEAARWLLEGAPDDVHWKRLLGVAIGMAAFVGLNIRGTGVESKTHPRAFDRLVDTLDSHTKDPHHVAWGMASALLKVYLDHAGISIPAVAYESTRAVCDAIANVLAERSAAATEEVERQTRKPGRKTKRRKR